MKDISKILAVGLICVWNVNAVSAERNAGYLAERQVIGSNETYTMYALIDEVTQVIENWVHAHKTICIEPRIESWSGSSAQVAPRQTVYAGEKLEVGSAWLNKGSYGEYSIDVRIGGSIGAC